MLFLKWSYQQKQNYYGSHTSMNTITSTKSTSGTTTSNFNYRNTSNFNNTNIKTRSSNSIEEQEVVDESSSTRSLQLLLPCSTSPGGGLSKLSDETMKKIGQHTQSFLHLAPASELEEFQAELMRRLTIKGKNVFFIFPHV